MFSGAGGVFNVGGVPGVGGVSGAGARRGSEKSCLGGPTGEQVVASASSNSNNVA